MNLYNIEIIQEVSSLKITKNDIICFKNKIKNISNQKVSDIVLKNYTSVDFIRKYYEFEKSREDIDINNIKGDIRIKELLPKDEIDIYITVKFEGETSSTNLKSYFQIDFSDKKNKSYKLKSNENIIEIANEKELLKVKCEINIEKQWLEEGDFYKLEINLKNNKNIPIKDVEIKNIIPKETYFLKDSLYINNSFINVGSNLTSVKLGEVMPEQEINIDVGIAINKECKSNKVFNKVSLNYKYIDAQGKEHTKIQESNSTDLFLKRVKIVDFKKTVDKKEVTLDEIVTFTITYKNNGNVKLYNIELFDEIDNGLEYIEGSLIINGRNVIEEKHNILKLDLLNINEEIKYEYKCRVKNSTELESKLYMKYKYVTGDSNKMIEKLIDGECEIVEVKYVDLSIVYTYPPKKNIFFGEEVEYEISIKNIGNLLATNILIKDFLKQNTKLVKNSICIDGVLSERYEGNEIKIERLYGGQKINIKYKIIAIGLNETMQSEKKGSITYSYNLHDEKFIKLKYFDIKSIQVRGAIIKEESLKKSVSKIYVGLDEEIDISICFENNGNYKAESVFVKEDYNSSLIFVKGSFKINGKLLNDDIEEGILIGDINPLEEIILSYKLKVVKIPYNDVTLSTTNLIYETIVDEQGKKEANMLVSQSDEIKIKVANINFENGLFIREVNNEVLTNGETVIFKMFLRNNGNVTAKNVVIDEGTYKEFDIIDNRVFINGSEQKISNGKIIIGNIEAGEDCDIMYTALIKGGVKATIDTVSIVNYGYYSHEGSSFIRKEGKSNLAQIKIYNTNIVFVGNSITSKVDIGEIFEYSLYAINKSDVNFYNSSLFLECEKNIQFEILEYKIDNMIQDIKRLNEKCYIESLAVNQSVLVTVSLRIENNSGEKSFFIKPKFEGLFFDGIKEKKIEKYGNVTLINIEHYNLKVIKKTARTRYIKEEIVDYLITIINDGMEIAENIVVIDEGLFKGDLEGKIMLNNIALNNIYINGIPIEKIEVGEAVDIRYSMKYQNENIEKNIVTKVMVEAHFNMNNKFMKKYKFISEEHKIQIDEAKISAKRYNDKEILMNGDKVRFRSIIENTGNVDLYNIKIKELVSNSFVEREVYINSFFVTNSDEDIDLPILKQGESYEVVTQYVCRNKECCNLVEDTFVKIEYRYQGFNKKEFSGEVKSNKVKQKISSGMFKNFTMQHKVYLGNLGEYKVSEITDVRVEMKITDQYIIKTIKNRNNQKNIATGKKAMIRGYLEEKIEYIAQDLAESLNLFIHKENFTTSIVVSEEFNESTECMINAKVENVTYKLLNDKFLLNNINMFIEVFD